MVTPELQEALSQLNLAERLDVIDLLQQSLVVPPVRLTDSQVEMIRQRDAEMDADPSIGLTWDEVRSRLLRR
ncbi:MAG: addiction module protein [Cellulomonas sp.]|jgi:putative addiction module component (TIGR02574 family)|nr:addiction module protein [Cellulomonas sp.]